MTVHSFEISAEHRDKWPPFADGCEKCMFGGAVVPFATVTNGDSLTAFYHHGRCGHRWVTSWSARYDDTWQQVIAIDGDTLPSVRPAPVPRALPSAGSAAA